MAAAKTYTPRVMAMVQVLRNRRRKLFDDSKLTPTVIIEYFKEYYVDVDMNEATNVMDCLDSNLPGDPIANGKAPNVLGMVQARWNTKLRDVVLMRANTDGTWTHVADYGPKSS